jgi:hypothetical protein
MAIIKDMQSKFGLDLTYHRITSFSINYVNKKAVICVASYINKDTRANHHAPLEEVDIEVPNTDFNLFQNANPIRQGYLWLKENVVGFEDAQDDMDVVETPAPEAELQPNGIE